MEMIWSNGQTGSRPAGTDRDFDLHELSTKRPGAHTELAGHARERHARLVPSLSLSDEIIVHSSHDLTTGDTALVEVADHSCSMNAEITGEVVDGATVNIC